MITFLMIVNSKMGKTEKDVKHSPLMALLPGANIDNEKGKKFN
jgi:hypothetical protein